MAVTTSAATHSKKQALRDMAGRIDELPLLPQSLVRILQIEAGDDNYFKKVEEYAKEEPGFAIRIVAMANSVASSPAAPVLDLNNAMVRIGGAKIRSLVASMAVQRVFVPTCPNHVQLWVHSILVAIATKRVAELIPKFQLDPNIAYLVGLLHDIGRFVMFEHAPDELVKVDESNWQTGDDLIRADVDVFMYTHCELGYLACKRWGLPDLICQLVRSHHTVVRGSIATKSLESLIVCNQIADRLSLSVLENESSKDLSDNDLKQTIKNACYPSTAYASHLPAEQLCKNVAAIRADGAALLAGLGFRV